MSGFEITCVNKDQRGQIIRLGVVGWTLTPREAVVKVISQQLRLYVRVENHLFDVGVRGEGFAAYLVIEPEGLALAGVAEVPSC